MPKEFTDAMGRDSHTMQKSIALESQYDPVFKQVFSSLVHKDYRNNENGRRLKVDYLLEDGSGKRVFVDDKADQWLAGSGNVSLEVFTVSPTGFSWGWMAQGIPTWLRYGSTKSPDLIGIPMEAAKRWVAARYKDFPVVSVVNRKHNMYEAPDVRKFSHLTFNLLVPLDTLLLALEDSWHLNVSEDIHRFESPTVASEWIANMRQVTPEEAAARMLSGPERIAYTPDYPTAALRDIIQRDRKKDVNQDLYYRCKSRPGLEDLFARPPVQELAMESDY